MSVLIVTTLGCQQCTIAKMMLAKSNMKYEEVIHDKKVHDDYPIVYIDNVRYSYRDFLKHMKEEKKK